MKSIKVFVVFIVILFSPLSSFANAEDMEKRIQAAEARAVAAEKRALEAEQRAAKAEQKSGNTVQELENESTKGTAEKRTKNKVWRPF